LQCSSLCEQTCGQPTSTCPSVCGAPKCQCASGYLRSGTACVLPYQCTAVAPTPAAVSTPACGQNEVYMTCSNVCEPQCGQTSMGCTTACGSPKCQCASGMVRSGTQCISPSACPQSVGATPTQTVCGANQQYVTCSSLCEPQCGQSNVMCSTACGPAKCQCVSGTFRSSSQQCVPSSGCPQAVTVTGAPPTAAPPTGSQANACNPSPCTITETCVPLSFSCTSTPCQQYTCVGKTGGKPPGATCISSTECESFNICYKGPFASMGLCLPGSG